MVGPMKLMMLAELESTGAEEISLFQRLSEGNGRKPLRLALWPTDICEQLELCWEPFTTKFKAEEELLPGSGLDTAIGKVPAELALPMALSCVEETKVVESTVSLRRTCAPEMKFVPVMVREKLPRFVEEGLTPTMVGVGLRSVTALDADFVESAALVAVTVMLFGEGRVAGEV